MKQLGIKNIITGIFVVAAVAAFMVFSGVVKVGTQTQDATGTVTVWGTIPYQTMQRYVDQAREQNLTIVYKEKRPGTYEEELVNAFAAGQGPDVFIMSHERILRHSDKVLEIPYASFPKDAYESTYIDEARLFTTDTGITAFPLTVDPLVMYYNKPLISSAFILDVPAYWDEFVAFAPEVTEYAGTGEISISAAALGTYDNIGSAKGILATLIMQNQNQIVGVDPTTNKKRSILALDNTSLDRVAQAVDFYTSFARFGADTYSWNEALIDSQNKFIAGEVALYIGRASEVETIRKKNPNLDFGVTLMPQVRGNTTRMTEGAMTGIAISKQTGNVPAALKVASKLAGADIAGNLAADLLVAPARKDLLGNTPDDALRTLVYNSAIISRGWFDPAPDRTSSVLRTLVRNVNTGALSTQDAISRANADLNTVLDQTINLNLGN
ncbi:extracellular solute-binding protein [Patescibacteria group bacterium]|mgnify:CR=1 FL=1|nr:extracellular solute-binding protein [Patescibacteria group bacterium]